MVATAEPVVSPETVPPFPNTAVDGYAVRTNHLPCGAMRGFGVVQACFAHESQMDKLAQACGLDAEEIDRRTVSAVMAQDVGVLMRGFDKGSCSMCGGPAVVAAVPEPSSLVVALLGVLGLVGIVRRQNA